MLVMTIAVYLYLPETKGVSLESMGEVWAQHWYWRRWSLRVDFNSESQKGKMRTGVNGSRASFEEL